jgi:hypothetical protein
VILYFIWLPTPELAIQRIAKRVREGGHNIPETVVRRRYARGLANLLDLYISIVDTTCIFNGVSFPPIPIAEIDGEKEWVLDYHRSERIQLHRKDDCIVRTNPMIKSSAPDSLIAKANLAFEAACRIVIERARQSGTEIVIWRDGQIVELSPEEATTELESNLAERESMLPNNTKELALLPTYQAINVRDWLRVIEYNLGYR